MNENNVIPLDDIVYDLKQVLYNYNYKGQVKTNLAIADLLIRLQQEINKYAEEKGLTV